MAQAIKRLYKDTKIQLAIGPAIENGFYYDFDTDYKFSNADLKNRSGNEENYKRRFTNRKI